MPATFIQAKWFRPGRIKPVRLIVVHCTVSPESPTGAEAVARYFQTTQRPASAHLIADNNSVIRCVKDDDTPAGAAGANADGLHLEMVGHADQTAVQWSDPYSVDMMAQAAPYLREWMDKYGIPPRWLTVAQVADGVSRGFCTHKDVSDAFPAVSTGHYDPGPNFPKDKAMNLWSPTINAPEVFVALTDAEQKKLVEDVALIRSRLATASDLDSTPVGGRSVVERRVADIYHRLADVEREQASQKATLARIEAKLK